MMSIGKILAKSNLLMCTCAIGLVLSSCAQVSTATPRNVDIGAPARAAERPNTINEGYEPVIYVPLGEDVLIPKAETDDTLPSDQVGPFQFRNETVAAALQLMLADYDIALSFETEEGLTRRVTVSNLKGALSNVVSHVCGLADLYCAYEDGVVTIKEIETFTVALPPLGETDVMQNIVTGVDAITGNTSILDETTRTIIYTATSRSAKKVDKYFERLRNNTALIIFETYIWEVELTGGNTTGIQWDKIDSFGAFDGFNAGLQISGGANSNLGTPISLGLPTRGNVNFNTGDILSFLSTQGNVKTISQPQLAVLSGGEATLRVAETTNYVESLSRTTDEDGDETVSTTVSSVDSGFTLTIGSSWDDATVYGNFEIELDELQRFQEFNAGNNETLQLPEVTERDLSTQVRVRPGDSVLIAGLVSEQDRYTASGLGLSRPLLPTSRTAETENSELVFLLRPRVVAYVPQDMQKEAQAALKAAQAPKANKTVERKKSAKKQVDISSVRQQPIVEETQRADRYGSSMQKPAKKPQQAVSPAMTEEQARLEVQNQMLATVNSEKQKALDTASQVIETKDETIRNLQQKLAATEQEKQAILASQQDIAEQSTQVAAQSRAYLEQYENEMAKMAATQKEYQAALDRARQEKLMAEEQLNLATSQLNTNAQELDMLKQAQNEATRKLNEAQAELASQQQALKQKQNEMQTIQARSSYATESLQNLESERQALLEELRKAKEAQTEAREAPKNITENVSNTYATRTETDAERPTLNSIMTMSPDMINPGGSN